MLMPIFNRKINLLRDWMKLAIAQLIVYLVPSTCPFERNITFFKYKFHIPSLCKFNPLYNLLMGWRFKALFYLSN